MKINKEPTVGIIMGSKSDWKGVMEHCSEIFKEFGINRWQWLPIDPQKNAVEPFRRLGENTVLETLDAHQTLCK